MLTKRERERGRERERKRERDRTLREQLLRVVLDSAMQSVCESER